MVQGQYVPLPPDTPSDLGELIAGLLRTAPAEREPQTARAALAMLRDRDQPVASQAELAAWVASARARHEIEGAASADVRPVDELAPGHVLAPGQEAGVPGPDMPASSDMIQLRQRAPRRVAFVRAAGVAAIAACVVGLGLVAHEHLWREQGPSWPLQPATVPGPEPAPAQPIVPVAAQVTPERAECPANVAETQDPRRADEGRDEPQRERIEPQRGARRSARARVRGKAVPLGGEPPPWARP